MREDVNKGVYVEGLLEVEVQNVQDVLHLLLLVGATVIFAMLTFTNFANFRTLSMQQAAVEQHETLNPIHPTNHKCADFSLSSLMKSANILEALPSRCPLCKVKSNDDCRLGFTSLVHCQSSQEFEGKKD